MKAPQLNVSTTPYIYELIQKEAKKLNVSMSSRANMILEEFFSGKGFSVNKLRGNAGDGVKGRGPKGK